MDPVQQPKVGDQSRLDFHMGAAFCRVAGAYPTLLDVILEQVQNALDANAKTVSVVLNRKTRHIAIRDDGDGVDVETFEQALQRVCLTGKERGKLGRFGIGLISPLDKCEEFTFTSGPKGTTGEYREWTFVTDNIRAQEKDVSIPRRQRPELFFIHKKGVSGKQGTKTVIWRTEVNIIKYSADKLISRITSIDALVEAILDRFSATMRKNDVVLNVKFTNESGGNEARDDIRAKLFTGRSLTEVVINEKVVGRVVFRLYLAAKTAKAGQQGKVIVGEIDNDYRFPFGLLARSANELLSDHVSAALLSGVFEGEIVGENVTLQATRKAFERDDAFFGFCTAIETWFEKHGANHLDEVKERERDKRYQDLGLESLVYLEEMFKSPAFDDLRSVFESFRLGTVGSGQGPREHAVGKQDERSLSTHGPSGEPKSPNEGEPAKRDRSGAETDLGHQPFTSAGPKGKQRTLVRRGNSGLQFSYLPMDGSDRLYEFDSRQGVLHFNINHPTWVACDVSDRKVRQLQESVAIVALTSLGMPDEFGEVMRYGTDVILRALVHTYHASPAFSYLRGKKRSKE